MISGQLLCWVSGFHADRVDSINFSSHLQNMISGARWVSGFRTDRVLGRLHKTILLLCQNMIPGRWLRWVSGFCTDWVDCIKLFSSYCHKAILLMIATDMCFRSMITTTRWAWIVRLHADNYRRRCGQRLRCWRMNYTGWKWSIKLYVMYCHFKILSPFADWHSNSEYCTFNRDCTNNVIVFICYSAGSIKLGTWGTQMMLSCRTPLIMLMHL